MRSVGAAIKPYFSKLKTTGGARETKLQCHKKVGAQSFSPTARSLKLRDFASVLAKPDRVSFGAFGVRMTTRTTPCMLTSGERETTLEGVRAEPARALSIGKMTCTAHLADFFARHQSQGGLASSFWTCGGAEKAG